MIRFPTEVAGPLIAPRTAQRSLMSAPAGRKVIVNLTEFWGNAKWPKNVRFFECRQKYI